MFTIDWSMTLSLSHIVIFEKIKSPLLNTLGKLPTEIQGPVEDSI